MDYARLFRLLFRHKWLILVVVALATTGTWFGMRLKGAVYEATVTLMPQEQALQTMEGVAGLSSSLGNQQLEHVPLLVRKSRVKSLIALMTSARVLGKLIAKLQIPMRPSDLEGMFQVDQVTDEVLRIHATAPTPELASDLANGLASTFVEFYGDLSTNAIAESTRLLNEQEARARKEMETRKTAVEKYKASHRITSLTEQLTGVLTRMNSSRQAREQVKVQLSELDAQLTAMQSQLASTPPVIQSVEKTNDSPAAQQLRTEIGTLEKELALERGTHTEMHPRVQELKAKLASASARLRQEEKHLVERIRYAANPDYAALQRRRRELTTERDGLAARSTALDQSIALLQKEMESYTGADMQLASLMQSYGIAQQRYAGLQIRLRQAEANADSIRRSSAIAIVDTSGPTNPPVDASTRKAKKITIASFVLSLGLMVFVLAAWDYLDRRVRTTADAEELVALPVAGIIPRALPRASSTPLPRLTALMPASPESEAYRFLSLHLLFPRQENPVRVLMMATAKPGQGATTTISNLAATLAQGNRSVILIDADLRRPSLHNLFEVSNEVGLTSVLTEGLPIDQALQPTVLPNLMLLPAGPPVNDSWALLRSPAMEELMRQLRLRAHFVLIDTPSCAAFADAFNLAPLVDGVFMVLRSRYQPTGIELKIREMFEEAGIKVFGAILNDVPMSSVESCRYHKEYYGSSPRPSGEQRPLALPAGRRD